MPTGTVSSGGLFRLQGGFAFHSTVNTHVCKSCGQRVHTVEVGIIGNPDITEAWADKYFWLNKASEEPEIPYTITLREASSDLPSRWTLSRRETADGCFDRHYMELSGEEYMELSEEVGIMGAAVALIDNAWPVLSGLAVSVLPCCFEFESCLFVHPERLASRPH